MTKKPLLISVTIAVIVGVAIYWSVVGRVPRSIVPSLPAPESNRSSSSTAQLLVPIDVFGGERINQQTVLVNSSTQARVTFEELNDDLHRGRSPSYGVFVNQIRIGEADGYLMMPEFSSDGKWLAFRSMWVVGCAGTCFDSTIYLVNLTEGTMAQISPPRKSTDYSGSVKIPDGDVNNAIIEPSGWDANALKVVFYYAGFSVRDNRDYRVGPKELWRYDLTTKQYTLLETLLEDATSSP